MNAMELMAMYRDGRFEQLSRSQKIHLLQKTVSWDAAKRGMKRIPRVELIEHEKGTNGQCIDGKIQMDEGLVMRKNCVWQILQALFHENIHAWQEQVIDGTIGVSDELLKQEYLANRIDDTAVKKDGKWYMGCLYLKGETSYYLYYFQATERDARRGAQQRTTSILESLSEIYGPQKSWIEYQEYLKEYGYEVMEKEAIEKYQNPDFVRDLNRVLLNQNLGIYLEVDEKTEAAVKEEMIATYRWAME